MSARFLLKAYSVDQLNNAGGIIIQSQNNSPENLEFSRSHCQRILKEIGCPDETVVVVFNGQIEYDPASGHQDGMFLETPSEVIAMLQPNIFDKHFIALKILMNDVKIDHYVDLFSNSLSFSIKKNLVCFGDSYDILINSSKFDELFPEQFRDNLKNSII